MPCSRCGAQYREDPSCGKSEHDLLPSRSLDVLAGWQIGLSLRGAPISDIFEADTVLATFGCKVDWDEDPANGVWGATLSIEIHRELLEKGFVDRTNPSGYRLQIEVDLDLIDPLDDGIDR